MNSSCKKVICYIDGFNLYHGLKHKNWKKFYWLDTVKFILHLGKYMGKSIKCYSCNKMIETFEEKQTDVCVAVKMIRNVILEKCDISILVSADSDLTPPIDFIREFNPRHKIFVYFPPARFSFDLQAKADNYVKIKTG